MEAKATMEFSAARRRVLAALTGAEGAGAGLEASLGALHAAMKELFAAREAENDLAADPRRQALARKHEGLLARVEEARAWAPKDPQRAAKALAALSAALKRHLRDEDNAVVEVYYTDLGLTD